MMYANCAQICVFLLCVVLSVSSEATSDTSSGYYGKKAIWTLYLDSAVKAIGKAKNSSITLYDTTGKCGEKKALMSYLEVADQLVNKAKINFPTIENCYMSPEPILDCSDLLRMGHRRSGVYTISPRRTLIKKKSFDVYCDMETDGGGWTVIQRRGEFQYPVDYFFRDWESYKEGFGDLEKEFWLGNDNIFALTNQGIYSARFDLVDFENNTRYAHYDAFWIDGETSKYTLHISGFSGNAKDAMGEHNNQKFSTKDQDNDGVGFVHCAQSFKGGWWFKHRQDFGFGYCFFAHLNGENLKGMHSNTESRDHGKIWVYWKGSMESIARTEIMMRPKNFRP